MSSRTDTSGTSGPIEVSPQATPRPCGPDPQLHVIVIALLGGDALIACLRSLAPQCDSLSVIGHVPPPEFLWVKQLAAPASLSVPHLRMQALQASSAPYVGLVEDTCVPSADWGASARAALSEPRTGAVSGAIDISVRLSAKDRALGLCEYAAFGAAVFPPPDAAPNRYAVKRFPGAHFALKRSAIGDPMQWPDGLIDNQLFHRLLTDGWLMAAEPAMRSTYAFGHGEGARLSTRYHHGRIYGGRFGAPLGTSARVFAAAATLLAPFLLSVRTLRRAPSWIWTSPATLSWIFAMHAAWSLGEGVGKLTGDVGDSLARWR